MRYRASWLIGLAMLAAGTACGGVSRPTYPFYAGILGGYGNTTWSMLVPVDNSMFVKISTPTAAIDDGGLYGALVGYRFSNHINFELLYEHFHDSELVFMQHSLYSPHEHITSNTSAYTLHAKLYTPLETIPVSVFATVGVSVTHRHDELADKAAAGGAFGVGFSHDMTSRWTGELAFQYHTGYAMTELKPVYDYIPFLYSIQGRIYYRFPLPGGHSAT